MNITKALSPNHNSLVAELFLTALGEKLIPILGDKIKAKRLLELSINPGYCFSATAGSQLLGVLAYQISDKNFLSISFSKIISVYGFPKGIIKAIGLLALVHQSSPDEIYLEAIVVSESARGKGVGSKLIEALVQFAQENNFKSITLQVIDTNPRAQELYERLGFRVVKDSSIWPLNKIVGFPFGRVVLMKKAV
jgi:ribosomal protein S18 acetylase RimI-like enzyme